MPSPYEQRVQQTAKLTIDRFGKSVATPEEVISNILSIGKYEVKAVEAGGAMRPAQKDFIKDVMKSMKEQGYRRNGGGGQKGPRSYVFQIRDWGGYGKVNVTADDLVELDHKIDDAVGNSFPDGDPIDHLTSFYKKKNWDAWDANAKLMPYVMKKMKGVKSGNFDDYLADMWDQVKGDNQPYTDEKGVTHEPDIHQALGDTNPWRRG